MRINEQEQYRDKCKAEKAYPGIEADTSSTQSWESYAKMLREQQIDIAAQNFIKVISSLIQFPTTMNAQAAIGRVTEAAMWAKKALEV